MMQVMVVPETIDFHLDVSHNNAVWINPNLGQPNLKGRNANYLAPYFLDEKNYGVHRIYHISHFDEINFEITLGNSFVLEEVWKGINQPRRFEYHSLNSFNFIEIKNGILMPYKF